VKTEFTPKEQEFINGGRTGEEILRRTRQVMEGSTQPAAVAVSRPLIPGTLKPTYRPTGNFALYRLPVKHIPNAFVRDAEPAPVLVELQDRTEAHTPSQRTINRRPAHWSGVEPISGKRHDVMYLYELETLEADHPLVLAEMKRRREREVLKTKMGAAALMFDAIRAALEQEPGAIHLLIDAYRHAGGEWDDTPAQPDSGAMNGRA
jgi:hypothetical protein